VGLLGTALVAGSAEELLDFGLQRGLHDQAGAQSRDVFENLGEVATAAEQRADLGADR
jgi:hypothetical protein